MASKHSTRALRQLSKQLVAPRVQQRTFVSALNATRPSMAAARKVAAPAVAQQTRGVKTVDFAGDKEVVYGKFSTHWVAPSPMRTAS